VYLGGKEEDMKRTLGIALAALVIAMGAGCKDKAAEDALAATARMKSQADLEARNVELVKTAIAQLEKGDIDVFTGLFAPDFKLYYPSYSTTPVTREDAMGVSKMMVTAVPDLVYDILDIFPAGERVVLRLAFRGTHRAIAPGPAPAEAKIAAGAIVIFRIKDGLITEEHIDGDALGLFRQLGLELKPKAPAK